MSSGESEERGPDWPGIFPSLGRTQVVGSVCPNRDVGPESWATITDPVLEDALGAGFYSPIQLLFPSLNPDDPVPSHELDTRARNALRRAGIQTLGGLLEMSPAEVLDMYQVGAGTVMGILRALVDQAVAEALDPQERAAGSPPINYGSAALEEAPSETENEVLRDLQTVAQWHLLRGVPDAVLVHSDGLVGAPYRVREAFNRIASLVAVDIAELEGLRPAELLHDALAVLDDRELLICRRRVFADNPETLDSIGVDLSVTRESQTDVCEDREEAARAAGQRGCSPGRSGCCGKNADTSRLSSGIDS